MIPVGELDAVDDLGDAERDALQLHLARVLRGSANQHSRIERSTMGQTRTQSNQSSARGHNQPRGQPTHGVRSIFEKRARS